LTTGKEQEFVAVNKPRSVAFAPDGKTLAVGSDRDHRVHLLNASTGKETALLQTPPQCQSPALTPLVFSPDGRWLACAYLDEAATPERAEGVFVWDMTTQKEEARRLPEPNPVRLTFAPDSKTLLCRNDAVPGQLRNEIHLWDVSSGRRLHNWLAHDFRVEALAISPDGKTAASGDGSGMLFYMGYGHGQAAPSLTLPGHDLRLSFFARRQTDDFRGSV
jgi:WD40 repeat protein